MTALASILVHFLWQGTLVALAVAAFLRFGPRGASIRYAAGVVALALMCAAPAATFAVLVQQPDVAAVSGPATMAVVDDSDARTGVASSDGPALVSTMPTSAPLPVDGYAPLVVFAWALGVSMFTIRLVGGWLVARRVPTVRVGPVPPDVADLAVRISIRMGLRRVVRVVESSASAVPVVIGWLRPVVVVPGATLAGLPVAQLEAVLAHELAHVRRHDYLVNLMQMVIETLFFYHPGVWWVSRRIRIEREHCCDDLAVLVCNRVDYAEALSALAAMNPAPGFALAATDGSLVTRLRRLFTDPTPQSSASVWLGAAAVVTILTAIPVGTVALTSRSVQSREDLRATVADSVKLVRGFIPAAAPADAGVDVNARPVATPGAPPDALRQSPSSAAEQGTVETDGFLAEQLQEIERQLRVVGDERMAVERTRASEEFAQVRSQLEARLVRLTAAFQESKARAEMGLGGVGEVRDIESQMVEVRGELKAIETRVRAREEEVDLGRREQILRASYESLLARTQGDAQARAERAEEYLVRARERVETLGAAQEGAVISLTHDANRVSFTPRSSPYVHGGPAVALPLLETGAKTPAGQPIAGIRFIGWREGNATRVMALVSTQREGVTTGSLEQDAGSYLLRFGDLLELKDLETFGISNVWLSSVAPVK